MSGETIEDPLKYYMQYAIEGQKSWISEGMSGLIPQSMSDAINLAKKLNQKAIQKHKSSEIKESLGKIFKRINEKHNVLTDRARHNLQKFLTDDTSLILEISHQPKFLGGERFLLNKIGCGATFANLDSSIVPIFYIADYDKVHSELIKTKFSQSDSSSGFSISIAPELENTYLGKSIRNLPLPSVRYLLEQFHEIRKKYSNSINSCVENSWHKKLLEERLEEALRIIRIAHNNAESYTDWFINIIGTISNIIYDQGYLFITASDIEFRKLLTPFYETLLQNQGTYVNTYNTLKYQFRQHNIKPPLRDIRDDFVPFFYECSSDECHCRRLELTGQDYASMIHVKCECSECGNLIDFSLEKNDPDLSEHAIHFTPRVETRQYLVSKTIQPVIHVAGTGEARYYTMGIPLIRRFDKTTTLPVIYFYNKITMNTFITRKIEQDLVKLNVPHFLDDVKSLMKNLGKFNKLLNMSTEKDQDRAKILDLLASFKLYMTKLENNLITFESSSTAPEESSIVSNYLSNMFGKISKEKHGQETVFSWIDLSLKNGLSNLFSDYFQIYKPWLPPGLEIFL